MGVQSLLLFHTRALQADLFQLNIMYAATGQWTVQST